MFEQPVQAGNSDIADQLGPLAHDLGGDLRLKRYQIGCPGSDYRQNAFGCCHPHEAGARPQSCSTGKGGGAAHPDAAGDDTDFAEITLVGINGSRLQFRDSLNYIHRANSQNVLLAVCFDFLVYQRGGYGGGEAVVYVDRRDA